MYRETEVRERQYVFMYRMQWGGSLSIPKEVSGNLTGSVVHVLGKKSTKDWFWRITLVSGKCHELGEYIQKDMNVPFQVMLHNEKSMEVGT